MPAATRSREGEREAKAWTAQPTHSRALASPLYHTTKYPVDPFAIAEGMGIPIRYADIRRRDADVLGFYAEIQGRQTILIDRALGLGWRRFICAHELGHAVQSQLGMAWSSSLLCPGDSEHMEIEAACDRFARNLLMPTGLVRDALMRTGQKPVLIAEEFGVPVRVARKRLQELAGGA